MTSRRPRAWFLTLNIFLIFAWAFALVSELRRGHVLDALITLTLLVLAGWLCVEEAMRE